MIVCITGTPGTGKTFFAKKLASWTGFRILDMNSFIKNEKLYDSYDRKDKTFDVDVDKLKRFMNMLLKKYRYNLNDKNQRIIYAELKKHAGRKYSIKYFRLKHTDHSKKSFINNIIIDGHLSHYVDADYCFVVKSDIKELGRRLKSRNYSAKKVRDNLESEIFDVCLEEAKSLKQRIITIEN